MGQLIPEATSQKMVDLFFNIVAERTSDPAFLRTPLSDSRDSNYFLSLQRERERERRKRREAERERTSRARIQDKTGR
jgi:hypothetical protein